MVLAPAMIFGDVESWAVVAAVLLLILLTVQMRRNRRRLEAKRDGVSDSEREPEGGP